MQALDLDDAIDLWPLGPGTKKGLQRPFPGLNSKTDLRQALRVLQRCLGAGQRQVPLVRISAFACFYKRQKDGKIAW